MARDVCSSGRVGGLIFTEVRDVRRGDWLLTRAAGLALLCLGALPFSAWIPFGMSDPGYGARWSGWLYGSAICIGVAVVGVIMGRGFPLHWAGTIVRRMRQMASRSPGAADGIVAVGCGLVYAVIARTVFDGRPLLIDEIVQVLQARMYAAGHLWLPAPQPAEFYSLLHVVDIGGRYYSQFPPGWPAMLALGTLVHAEWLVGPVCGAVAVFAFARLMRRIFAPTQDVSICVGTLLFGLGPFAAFQFGSHMSHGPFVMWLVLSTLAVTRGTSAGSHAAGWAWGLATGMCGGLAFAVRPLDGVAYGVVAAAWLVWRARSPGVPRTVLLASMLGLAAPVLTVLWINTQTTGSAAEFGYQVLWGSAHGLGFHAAPWGDAHTPQRGVELLSLYATRLNVYLFETPFPSLLPVIVGLFTVRTWTVIERYLALGTLAHGALYFAYWHDGFYLGPRFVTPWIPILILLCIRGGQAVYRAKLPKTVRVGIWWAVLAAIVLTVTVDIPSRVAQYRTGLMSMREDYAAAAAQAGARNALVFVRESWGAQLVARLWALGVSRSAAAGLYAHVDACVLEHAIGDAERGAVRGTVLEQTLRPLTRDSLRVLASNVSPDTTERMLPGTVYDSTCTSHVELDREGYALYPPFLLDNRTGNVYVREFQARDSVLLRIYGDRQAFVVARRGVDGVSPLVWSRIR